MIEFYNRQANEGIRADPADCIAAIPEKRLDVLKESQIRSWWSSYQKKRKRENERLAANLRQLQGRLTSASCLATSVSVDGNNVPSIAPAATLNSTQPSVTSAATLNSTQPSVTSAATVNARQPTPALQIDLLGANIGNGVTGSYFPWNMSQSTINNRNGSNACVFIAFNFGFLYKQFSLDNTLVGQSLNSHWQTALEHAIRAGNDVHDQLFDFEGVDVSVKEGIELAGEMCRVGQVLREYNVFGANPLDQLETVVKTLSQQCQPFHVLIALEMAMLIIVDSCGVLFFIDSHIHGKKGAVIVRFNPDSHC